MRQPRIGRQRAFTLIELLVAIFITSIVFALGYGAINQALNNRERLQLQQQRLVAVQRAMRLLVQDLAQATPRSVRDEVGNAYEPAFWGNTPSGILVAVTRSGWSNPAGVQRASLQRVRWRLVDGRLRRETRLNLDAVSTSPVHGRDVLDGVRAARMRFMTINRDWLDSWPPPAMAQTTPQSLRARPLAVEVTLELEDWGTVTRVIEVAR